MTAPWEQFQTSESGPWDQFKAPTTEPVKQESNVLERIGTGLADPVWGAMQTAAHVIPGVDAKIVDQMVKDREAEYEKNKAASGQEGFDWARLAGNVVNPINLAGGAGAAQATTLGGRMLAGAALGGASSLLTPVTKNTENFASEKGAQAVGGALTGAAIPAVGAGAARIINPQTAPEVKTMISKGITPTLGEMLGPSAKSFEERLMSVPIVGDVISSARRGSIDDMNRALYNMALEPIGEKSTQKIGRAGISEVADKLSAAYNKALSGKQVSLDNAFDADLAKIWDATSIMSDSARKQFKNIVLTRLVNSKGPNGILSGETVKAVDSQLGGFASQFGKDQDLNNRMIGDALNEVKGALRSAVARSNPDLSNEIAKIDQGWTIYTRLRNASARTGSKEGVITPGTLNAAVTALDKTIGKGATAKGTAPMREFTDQAISVLGSSYPDSGTTGRAMMNLLLLGGGMYVHPASVMFGGLLTTPYMPGVKGVVAKAMTARPTVAEPISNAVRQGAQYAIPGITENVQR